MPVVDGSTTAMQFAERWASRHTASPASATAVNVSAPPVGEMVFQSPFAEVSGMFKDQGPRTKAQGRPSGETALRPA